MKKENKEVFRAGIRDGMPIALGYFAVAFSLGIAARNVGLTWFEATLASFLNNASAGEYALFTLIGAGASLFEIALMTLITNARYLLMSTALSQKLDPALPLIPRLIVGFDVTDEVFGISISYPGRLNPVYNYGAMSVAIPGWALGTGLGVIMGNVLPGRVVSALSVALFGMFIAIIIPPARRDKVVCALVISAMVLSGVVSALPCFAFLTAGTRVIILTVALSAFAAWRFPHKDEEEAKENV